MSLYNFKDLSGQTFGRLTVLHRQQEPMSWGRIGWICQCECGNIVTVAGDQLKRGKTKSCGCWKREFTHNHMKMYGERLHYSALEKQKYEFDGDVGKCYFNNGDGYFLFDTEDYEKIKNYVWHKGSRGYVVTMRNDHQKLVGVHRLIMDCPDGMVVDHINHDKLDNRKCNLRVCTQAENSWNKSVGKRNRSGYNGVYVVNVRSKIKYRAGITVNHKVIYLGIYSTAEEAYEARLKAEKFYYGEFAPR